MVLQHQRFVPGFEKLPVEIGLLSMGSFISSPLTKAPRHSAKRAYLSHSEQQRSVTLLNVTFYCYAGPIYVESRGAIDKSLIYSFFLLNSPGQDSTVLAFADTARIETIIYVQRR
jgi:hypothetical protein